MSKTTDQATKDASARLRSAMDKDSTHIRCGDWRTTGDSQITLVGHVADLHGTVCTCCPRKAAS